MNSSKKRKDGGAYRRAKNMIRLHAKEGKDRAKSKARESHERNNTNKPA